MSIPDPLEELLTIINREEHGAILRTIVSFDRLINLLETGEASMVEMVVPKKEYAAFLTEYYNTLGYEVVQKGNKDYKLEIKLPKDLIDYLNDNQDGELENYTE